MPGLSRVVLLHGAFGALVVVLGLLSAAVPADAQSRRWYGPYRAGVQSIERGDWHSAISSLQTAAEIEPGCESGKIIEGNISDDYCPSVYLAEAYLGAREFAEAERLLDLRGRLPKAFARKAEEIRARLKAASSVAQFETAKRAALDSIGKKDFTGALAQLSALRNANSAAFRAAGLEERLEEANVGMAGALSSDGRGLLALSRFKAAERKFAEAESLVPAFAEARAGVSEIRQREVAYERHKAASLSALGNGEFEVGLKELDAARRAHVERYRVDGLRKYLSEAAAATTVAQPGTGKANQGLVRIRCDDPCAVKVGSGPVWRLDRADTRLVPSDVGAQPVSASSASGALLWKSVVSVRVGETSELAVPIRAETARLSSLAQREQRTRAQLQSTQARVADLRADTDSVLSRMADAQRQVSANDAAVRALVQRITTLEASIDSELKLAEKEERDAATAESNARNSLLGSSGFGRFVQGLNAVGSGALKFSADRRRRRAQEMLVEIGRLSEELYRATVQ